MQNDNLKFKIISWNKIQIKQHKRAAELLNKIRQEAVTLIRNNNRLSDVVIRRFIKYRYNKYHLKSDKQSSIVAFGSDTSNVHFYAVRPRRLRRDDLIMIDIWAKLAKNGAPFADTTWMLYYGRRLPRQYTDVFKIVTQARDRTVKYLKSNLKNKIIPLGKEIDAVARNYLAKHGYGKNFLHGTGHSLGLTSPHGRRTRINRKGRQSLPLNTGYTIEPGIYFQNKFGIRSEINFYIDKNYKLIVTTKVQKKIIII